MSLGAPKTILLPPMIPNYVANVFAIMNAASHAITEGMRVDLQSSGCDDARMFHHFEIELMLTVYNGLVKASFGKHHDSDPTNSRRTDETYEETLLPLIGQLTSFTFRLWTLKPSVEILTVVNRLMPRYTTTLMRRQGNRFSP